jgi:hypothetical protein
MTKAGNFFIAFIKTCFRKHLISPKLYLSFRYLVSFKRWPDLKNPKLFNEKIQYSKLQMLGDKRYLPIVDKLTVREYVNARVDVQFPKILFITEDPLSFDFESLKESLVIKANHGSGWYDIISRPTEIRDWSIRRLNYKKWLQQNFWYESVEPQYDGIRPILFGEEYLGNLEGPDIVDYKFHCINGEVEFIHVASDRTGDTKRNFFSPSWIPLEMYWGPISTSGLPLRKKNLNLMRPKLLTEMINIARTLSSEFSYIRVDMYEFKGDIYFGELTFHPGAGFETFVPNDLDRYYGDRWTV